MSYRTRIDSQQDIMDSRDVIKYFDDLESEHETLVESVNDEGIDDDTKAAREEELKEFEEDEYNDLKAFIEEASGSPDWVHGETLIRDSYFETYARQLADDLGCVNSEARWPNDCIDWEQAAEE